MPPAATFLVLGGTRRARNLLDWLNKRLDKTPRCNKVRFIYSLAGATSSPLLPKTPCLLNQSHFGGMAPFRAALRDKSVTAIIEVLHPFATNMRLRVREAAWCEGIPIFHLRQKAWIPQARDVWFAAETDDDILHIIERYGFNRVMITLGGRLSVDWLVKLNSLNRAFVLCRGIAWPDGITSQFPNITFVSQRPPFSVEDEEALMSQHQCDVLVAKNSGQSAAVHKMLAARRTGVPVILRTFPDPGTGESYHHILSALQKLSAKQAS